MDGKLLIQFKVQSFRLIHADGISRLITKKMVLAYDKLTEAAFPGLRETQKITCAAFYAMQIYW